MGVRVLGEGGTKLAPTGNQRTPHVLALLGRAVNLRDGLDNQCADRDARPLRPMPEPVIQRFRDANGSPDGYDTTMS